MHLGRRRYVDSCRARTSLRDSKMSIFRYTCFISLNSQHDSKKWNRYNVILTFCNRVVKSEVRRSRRRRNIVSDMSEKFQYFVRGVLNHDFVDDLLMSREESLEVSSRRSCAQTSNMTEMQTIIIPFLCYHKLNLFKTILFLLSFVFEVLIVYILLCNIILH